MGGFGSSLFFVGMASFFLDFESVLGITAIFHLSSNITKIYLFRKGFDKNLIYYIGIPSVITVIIGAFMSKLIDTYYLQIGLAIFLVSISVLMLILKNFSIAASKKNSIVGGSLSGLTSGLIGTGGAIRGIVLSAYSLEIDVFIATSAVIDLAIDFSRSVVYTANGYVHKEDLYLIPILFAVSILGSYIGKLILNRMSKEQFRIVVLLLILLTGVATLLKQFV